MFETSKLLFFNINIPIEIGQIVPHLLWICRKLNDSLSFSSSFIVNFEPIEQNINGIFTNKYGKHDVDCEIMNI
jgi:hypothetical protein